MSSYEERERGMLTPVAAAAEFFVVIAVALAAVLLGTIDARGFTASVVVGLAIIYGGGLGWFIVVAAFFILGVAFTLYKYGYKKKIGGAQDKGGARNWPNILANGGFASVVAVVNYFYPGAAVGALFLGAMSTSAADTAATELGLLSRSTPRLITHPSRGVTPGTSGGVSGLGFVGAAFSSLVIGALGAALGVLPSQLLTVAVCFIGGLAGSVVDSLVGAVAQRKGYCVVCHKPTEALRHCGAPTKRTGGVPYIENNVVNVVATVTGGLVSLLTLLALAPMV